MSIQAISDVLPILDSLESKVTLKDSQKILQDLLKMIPKAIDQIIIFQRKPEMKKYSNKMKLCCSQMVKVLPPLCRVISSGTDPAFKEICHYLVAKLRWCLTEIVRILNGGGDDGDSDLTGLFIQSVDNFVIYLSDEKKGCHNMSLFIDDLLCHALTIAKMSENNEDYNEITAACRKVLANTSGVSTIEEIGKEPLRKDAVLCSLVNLEKKINTAVLRLFLFVMSKFLPPLKNIIKKSGTNHNDTRQIDNVDQDLNSLDAYFEKVLLVGNYAVACTDCTKQKLKVQCSLASVEFLSNYILPAAESFYMDPTNLIKRRFLQFLTDECMDELKTLTSLLDHIIDTPSFFQVLREDLIQSIPSLKTKFSKGIYDPQESSEIITKCYKVVSHLKTTNDPVVRENQILLDKTKDFLTAVRSHADLVRDKKMCNEKNFCENLDYILQKVEELDEHLTRCFMSRSQKIRDSIMFPVTPMSASCQDRSLSLDPYLDKIFETPVLHSTLYSRTPYKSIKMTPRNLSLDISEVLESLDISYTPDEEEASSNNTFPISHKAADGSIQDNILTKDISVGFNTRKNNFDLDLLENKMKHLASNEP